VTTRSRRASTGDPPTTRRASDGRCPFVNYILPRFLRGVAFSLGTFLILNTTFPIILAPCAPRARAYAGRIGASRAPYDRLVGCFLCRRSIGLLASAIGTGWAPVAGVRPPDRLRLRATSGWRWPATCWDRRAAVRPVIACVAVGRPAHPLVAAVMPRCRASPARCLPGRVHAGVSVDVRPRLLPWSALSLAICARRGVPWRVLPDLARVLWSETQARGPLSRFFSRPRSASWSCVSACRLLTSRPGCLRLPNV